MPVVFGRGESGKLTAQTGGFVLATDRFRMSFDLDGQVVGVSNPQGAPLSVRNMSVKLLLDRLSRFGINRAEKDSSTTVGAGGTQLPEPVQPSSATTGPASTPSPSTAPDSQPMRIGPITSHQYPSLLRKGVSHESINSFMQTVQSVFRRHGVELNAEHLAVITGNCLQENSLKTGPSTHGVGICQWTKSRATALERSGGAYRSLYPQASALETQAAFMLHEMGRNVGVAGAGFGIHKAAGDILLTAKTFPQAAAWMFEYERYGTEGARKLFAAEILRALQAQR